MESLKTNSFESTSLNPCTLTHNEIIPLLKERQGRQMIANMLLKLKPWKINEEGEDVNLVWYSTLGEFNLGICEADGATGRVDAAIVVKPLELQGSKPYCRICAEVKGSMSDLKKDKKLEGKYINSGQFDYYFLIAANDEIAKKAVEKYQSNPIIGVASMESGRVFKDAPRQYVETLRALNFDREVYYRSRLKTSQAPVKYREFMLKDDENVLLMLDRPDVVIPTMIEAN